MAEQRVGLAADGAAGEQVVEQEERGHLEEARQAAGERRHLLGGVQLHDRLLHPLRVLAVLLAEFGDLRLEPAAGLLTACGGPRQGVDGQPDERGEQDDRGGGGRGLEERLEQVGEGADQARESGHEGGHG
ncbi:hypothetical protein M2436_002561 [Streptomyces sp. HB372]|nr:hypothetical protein [Streptomyces sp. HB372]